MKLLPLIALLLVGFVGCTDRNVGTTGDVEPSTTVEAAATPAVFNAAGAPTVQFSVPDMVCESCSAAVHETLAAQPGAQDVTVDLETKLAPVAVDREKFDEEAAVAALLDKQFSNAKLLAAPETPKAPAPTESPQAPNPASG